MADQAEAGVQRPGKRYSWKVKLAALAIACVFSLLVVEVALRVLPQFAFLGQGWVPMYAPDDTRGWRLRENFHELWHDARFQRGHIWVTTDELGNRRIPPPNKSAELPEYRILLIGDSFTFGWGVEGEQTYGAVLQDELNAALPELRVRVFNSGVPAYGPQNEFETLKKLAPALKPNLVVLGFTENDFENAATGPAGFVVRNGWLVASDGVEYYESFTARAKRFIVEHCAVARLAYYLRSSLRPAPNEQSRAFLGYMLEILRKEPAPEIVEAIGQTKTVLGQIRDYCAERKIAFQIVSFPRSYQVFEQEFLDRLRSSGASPEDFSTSILSERIKAICDELAVPHAGVQAPFDAARDAGASRDELYIPNDGHWTVRGHELAAGAMLGAIEQTIRESSDQTEAGPR
jgi:hypothetical protein